MNRIIYLYIKESPLGLKYLGITIRKDPYKYLGSGTYWTRHLKLHNFKSEDIKTDIILKTEDRDIIKFWGLYYSKIWNIVESKEWANLVPENTEGFLPGRKLSQKEKERISKINKGKKFSENHKQKIRIAHLGKVMPQETKDKISKSKSGSNHQMFGKHLTNETKNKIGTANKKPILQYSLNGEFIKEWKSAMDASKKLKITDKHIGSVCNNKRKSSCGFIWKYKTNNHG